MRLPSRKTLSADDAAGALDRAEKARAIGDAAEGIAGAALKAGLLANAELRGKIPNVSADAVDDWPTRVELVGFYLHAADRYAFFAAGAEVRDELLEAATFIAARTLVDASWKGEHVAPGFDFEAWSRTTTEESIANFEAANAEYGASRQLLPREDENLSDFSEDWALTGLLNRIVAGANFGTDAWMRRSAVNDVVPGGIFGTLEKERLAAALAVSVAVLKAEKECGLQQAVRDAVKARQSGKARKPTIF